MFLMLFVFFFCLSYCMFLKFSSKLIILLLLEGSYLFLVFVSYLNNSSFSISFFYIFFFSLMMVLDSVLGLSSLIYDSRNSSSFSLCKSFF